MHKTPDEIKKGLECCISNSCNDCPYVDEPMERYCKLTRTKDSLALIQQLQAENAEKDARIHQLEVERDAALADFKIYRERNIKGECGAYACDLCKQGVRYEEWEDCKCPKGCMGIEHWEWRGVTRFESFKCERAIPKEEGQ